VYRPSRRHACAGRGGGGGGPKPQLRAAAEYSTRALESAKDQLALHQTVVDDANDRVRAIEHERSHLTADYMARVERLQAELAVSSQRLMHTKMTIQARTDELTAATDRARALVRLTGPLYRSLALGASGCSGGV